MRRCICCSAVIFEIVFVTFFCDFFFFTFPDAYFDSAGMEIGSFQIMGGAPRVMSQIQKPKKIDE